MNSTGTVEDAVSGKDEWTTAKTILCSFIALICVLTYFVMQTVRRNGGRNILYHVFYFSAAAALIIPLPNNLALQAFNPFTITAVCTLYPIYESIKAICTVDTDDDTAFLQYWIAQGILSFASYWVDDATTDRPVVRQYWYEFLFVYYLWLLLPFTDGAALLYDFVTEPLIVPLITPHTKKMTGWVNTLVTAFINAFHLWFVWFAFFFLPPSLKSFIAICVGTVYPFMASIVAVSTPQGDDDTFWLTYWSCYGILYLVMGFFEQWLKNIPGFYLLYIIATVYLMLPMFKGADKIFREILVPLSGQTEMLLIRDAQMLRMELEAKLPDNRKEDVLKSLTKVLTKDLDEKPAVKRRSKFGKKATYGSVEEESLIV